MRCVKCGYISFDHLSECKKCHAGLTNARVDFGFFAERPESASLLGSLLRGYDHAAPGAVPDSEALDRLGLQAGAAKELSNREPAAEEAPISMAIMEPDGTVEDFSLPDLSENELDLLIGEESLEDDEDAPPMESADDHAGRSALEHLKAEESAPVERIPATKLDSGITFAPAILEERLLDFPSSTVEQLDFSTDDFAIDLSDSDIEALLEELGTTQKTKPETSGSD